MKYLFGIILFFIPFIFAPWMDLPFEIPKVWVYQRLVELFILTGAIQAHQLKKKPINKYIVMTSVLFVVWATIASIIGVDFLKSFWGNYYRGDGLLTLYHYLGFCIMLMLYWEKDWFQFMKRTLTITALALSLWALYSFVFNAYIPPYISFGHPVFLSIYLSALLPLLASFVVPIVILAILSTKTLAGLVGVGLFLSLRYLSKKKVPSVRSFALLLSICIVMGGLFLFMNNLESSPYDNRQRIMVKGLIGFTQKPFSGWGWSNFDYAFESVVWPMKYRFDIYYDKAHSTMLEVLTTTGIVGLSLYIALIIQVFRALLKMKRYEPLLSSFFICMILFQTNVYSVDAEILFWSIVGISASFVSQARPKPVLRQMVKNRSR